MHYEMCFTEFSAAAVADVHCTIVHFYAIETLCAGTLDLLRSEKRRKRGRKKKIENREFSVQYNSSQAKLTLRVYVSSKVIILRRLKNNVL